MSEALTHLLNPVARFSELDAGELFRFPGSQVIHTKTKSGYRTGDQKPVWKTGARVAVIPVQRKGESSGN
jgi:hypothetical protein